MSEEQFQWQDPFLFEQQLSEEERMVRDSTRSFAQSVLEPRVVQDFREGTTDRKVLRQLGEVGLLGTTIPEEFGGVGLSYVSYGLIARELERVDSGYRSTASIQTSLVMTPILEFGTKAQREKYFPKLITGELIGCFGLTEPDFGSDAGSLKTRAMKTDGGYILRGAKTWISNSPIADIFIVWAKEVDKKGNVGPIRGFILERDFEGISTPTIHGKIAMRASITGEIVMDDVFCPEENAFPEVRGLRGPFTALNNARYGICWGAMGIAEDCWHTARNYTMDRNQFGRPLAANQLIQKKLADMQTEIGFCLQGCLRLGKLKDQGKPYKELTSLVKRSSTMKAREIARTAREMLGANGISDEFRVARHMCNLEGLVTYEGTSDIHALILGRSQTGIAAFTN